MEYDTDALSEISLLGDVLAAAAHARSRIPTVDLDRLLQVPVGAAPARWQPPRRSPSPEA